MAVLRNKNGIKDGTTVIYSLCDPLIKAHLLITRGIFDNHLIDAIFLLEPVQKAWNLFK